MQGTDSVMHSTGQGDETCISTSVLDPPQRVIGSGRRLSLPGCSGNCRGCKRMCRPHVFHHWMPREVQDEVTALGIRLEAQQDLFRAGAAVGACGSSTEGGGNSAWC